MSLPLSDADQALLRHAIDISRHALEDEGNTPFGAVVAIDDEIVGRGTSSVMIRHDPTAHAEVMALREAGAKLGRHLMPDAVMYASSEPCPMCLAACYWAQIPRLVFAATTHDVATHGFEDLQLYRELALPMRQRGLTAQPADDSLREAATSVLRDWAARLPEPVRPKY